MFLPTLIIFCKAFDTFSFKQSGLENHMYLKGYCTVFQHALKSLEITDIVLSLRTSKTARKNSKGLKSYKEFTF